MKILRLFLGFIISIVFLYLSFRKISLSEFLFSIKNINLLWLFLGILVQLFGFWVRSWRWQRLLLKVKIISVKELFPFLSIGYMANNVLPFRLGELARAYVLGKKQGVSKSATLATILIERIFDWITLVFFILVLLLPIFPSASILKTGWLEGLVLFALVAFGFLIAGLYATIFFKDSTIKFFKFIFKLFPTNLSSKLNNFLEFFISGFEVLKVKRVLLEVFLLSVAIWLLEAGMFYLSAVGFGFQIPFSVILLLTSIVNIGIMIPSAPGYVGTFEFFIKEILILFLISSTSAVSYSVVVHLAQWLPITLIGMFYLSKLGIGLKFLGEKK